MAVLVVYLGVERLRLARDLRRVPLRICVTGTRGKSSVVRLIAAVLRGAGMTVLAKTTGSKPVLILPDGTERDIERSGPPAPLEQIALVREAARRGARVIVAELMSVRPESLAAESRRILRPGILVITNARLDHLEAMGETREAVAESLAAAVPEGGSVFVPAEEMSSVFENAAARAGARLIAVPEGEAFSGPPPGPVYPEFEPNTRLALAVARHLGVAESTARAGLAAAVPDFGSLKVWIAEIGDPPRRVWLASAFAANEPESTVRALDKLRDMIPAGDRPLVGLLNLRDDRGDRARQWLVAAKKGFFDGFSHVAVTGGAARAFLRLLGNAANGRPAFSLLSERSPDAATRRLAGLAPGEALIVGLGNMGGAGERFVESWSRLERTPHDKI